MASFIVVGVIVALVGLIAGVTGVQGKSRHTVGWGVIALVVGIGGNGCLLLLKGAISTAFLQIERSGRASDAQVAEFDRALATMNTAANLFLVLGAIVVLLGIIALARPRSQMPANQRS